MKIVMKKIKINKEKEIHKFLNLKASNEFNSNQKIAQKTALTLNSHRQ